MRISLTSVPVGDQKKALAFYTDVLGFQKKQDILMGPVSFLTVVSPEDPNGPELMLEPNADHPQMKALREALVRDGIPYTAFQVQNIGKEVERLKKLGVVFRQEPVAMGPVTQAVFDDTCGNLIQIYQV